MRCHRLQGNAPVLRCGFLDLGHRFRDCERDPAAAGTFFASSLSSMAGLFTRRAVGAVPGNSEKGQPPRHHRTRRKSADWVRDSVSHRSNFARIEVKPSDILTLNPKAFVITCMARLSAIISDATDLMPS